MRPVFVEGDISFSIEGERVECKKVRLSQWGASGLAVPVASYPYLCTPATFDQEFLCEIESQVGEHHLFMIVAGHFVRESTSASDANAMRFSMSAEQEAMLGEFVTRFGFAPKTYERKSPRIPSDRLIPTFPLKAMVVPRIELSSPSWLGPISFDISNLSPHGALLSSENQNSLKIRPGERILIVLEPRGWFPSPIKVSGIVCRVLDDLDAKSGNQLRFLGVRFTAMDVENRAIFLDLLQDILERLSISLANAA